MDTIENLEKRIKLLDNVKKAQRNIQEHSDYLDYFKLKRNRDAIEWETKRIQVNEHIIERLLRYHKSLIN